MERRPDGRGRERWQGVDKFVEERRVKRKNGRGSKVLSFLHAEISLT